MRGRFDVIKIWILPNPKGQDLSVILMTIAAVNTVLFVTAYKAQQIPWLRALVFG